MSEVFTPAPVKDPPDRIRVLRDLGIPKSAEVPERVLRLVDRALELYASVADPRALWAEVTKSEFESIYRGEGLNDHRTPLETVFPRADRLALYAATLGAAVSRTIDDLFRGNEPATACVLDTIASERADRASELTAERFLRGLVDRGTLPRSARVLAYSPGYCGWHVTGQRRLFARLRPERIDVKLNASCLMQPLKSVSGVLVAGPAEIHDFDNDFDFCDACATYQCRDRIASLARGGEDAGREGGPGWRS